MFVRLREGRPDWIAEAIRDAHGADFLPDDYRYEFAREAFQTIADAGEDADLDDVAQEFADDVDVFTGALLGWLGSNLQRIGYVDQARDEFGSLSFNSVENEIAAGQAIERREVFETIRDAIEAEADAVGERMHKRMSESGEKAGRAAGSWVSDGNSSEEHLRWVLRSIEECEFDIPAPLSGEFADGWTSERAFEDADVERPEDDDEEESLLDAWEDGYRTGYEAQAAEDARGFLPDGAEHEGKRSA